MSLDQTPLATAARLQRQAFIWEQEAFRLLEKARVVRAKAHTLQLENFRPTVVRLQPSAATTTLQKERAKAERVANELRSLMTSPSVSPRPPRASKGQAKRAHSKRS